MSKKDGDQVSLGDLNLVNDDNFSWLPDKSVDLVLTDPPFNIARDTNFHTYEKNTIHSYRFDEEKGWDSYSREQFVELLRNWSSEFNRVLRPGGGFAIFCADDYISDLKQALTGAGLKARRTLTWRKPNAVPINSQHMMMSACEYVVIGVKGSKATFKSKYKAGDPISLQETVYIADKVGSIVDMELKALLLDLAPSLSRDELAGTVETFLAGRAKELGKRVARLDKSDAGGGVMALPNFVNFNSAAGNRIHPTEKPVPLLKYLISLLSNPGDLILDPFAGSGSTGQAALELQRRAVLVEKEAEFFLASKTRLQKTAGNDNATLI